MAEGMSAITFSPEPLKIKVQPATVHYVPPDALKNDSEPRGAVFIANFARFDLPYLEYRTGSETNVQQLRTLFTQMGYKVTEGINNGTKENTLRSLESFCKLDIHSRVDSMVVIFMSHGTENSFFTSDGQLIHYKQVYQMFSDKNCPALKGKPKIFMFQFCRSKQRRSVQTPPTDAYANLSKKSRYITHTYVCLSTAEGQKAYRYHDTGAVFFYHVCKEFMNHAKDKEFDTLMKRIEKALPDQQPSVVVRISIKDNFYFNPPFENEMKSIYDNSAEASLEDALTSSTAESGNTYLSTLKSDDCYKRCSPYHGCVLIINNLVGCQDDVEKLSDIFTQLCFKIMKPISNASYDEMIKQFEAFKQQHHYDAAIVIFYGLGFEDHLVSHDNIAISHKDVIKHFNDSNCNSLAGKPKLFIFNSCITDIFQYPPKYQSVDNETSESQEELTAHDHNVAPPVNISGAKGDDAPSITADKDMIVYSVEVERKVCVDGSLQECADGSLLTEILYQVLLDSRNSDKELFTLLKLLTKRLEEMSAGKAEEYFVVTRSIRFQKDFFFTLRDDCAIDGGQHNPRKSKGTKRKRINISMNEVDNPIVGDNIYRTISWPRGRAVIIGFTNYEMEQIPECDWHSDEAEILGELAVKLGYSISCYRNQTHGEIKAILENLNAAEELEKIDSLMIMISGLGHDMNHVYGTNDELVPLVDILNNFTNTQCPKLKGKPKIFLFSLTKSEKWENTALEQPAEYLRDTFVLYTISNFPDNGDGHHVSGLHMLCKVISEKASTTDFENLIMEAEEELNNATLDKNHSYILKPIMVHKDFYFNPKFFKPS